MPLRVVNDPDTRAVCALIVACNACGEEVDDRAIAERGGLLNMGWLRRFNEQNRQNEYFCPDHHPEKEQSSGN